jgi:hypothetical protein
MEARAQLLFVVALVACASPRTAAQAGPMALVRESDIVFVGSVVRVGAASFPAVPASARSLVVQVEDVLAKPVAVRLAVGDSVTVEARTDSGWQQGTRATFYTTGWIFGQGVAVREVGHEAISGQRSAAGLAQRRATFLRWQRQVSDSVLQERVRAADMIVVGRVETVRAPTLMPQPRRRITEHDADWQEAIIVVDTMLKGPATPRVVVRFPGSLDIAWHRMPKFTAGEEGTFLLRRDSLSGAPHAMLAGRQVTAYTVASPEDVLSRADAQRVRALVRP